MWPSGQGLLALALTASCERIFPSAEASVRGAGAGSGHQQAGTQQADGAPPTAANPSRAALCSARETVGLTPWLRCAWLTWSPVCAFPQSPTAAGGASPNAEEAQARPNAPTRINAPQHLNQHPHPHPTHGPALSRRGSIHFFRAADSALTSRSSLIRPPSSCRARSASWTRRALGACRRSLWGRCWRSSG